MIRVRRRGLALVGTAVLTAGVLGVTPATVASARPNALSAIAATPFSQAQFSAYGTGSEVHLSAVSTGTTTLAGVEQAFSGVTVSSGGLGPAVSATTGALVQPALSGGPNAYAKGSGLEVGLAASPGTPNQVLLPDIAQAQAPPPSGLVTKRLLPLDIPGISNGAVLNAHAAASYNNTFCPLGQPIAYGEGDATDVGLLGGVVNTAAGTNVTAQSQSRTDLVANADGTFGIQTTVTESVAPLSVNLFAGAALTINIASPVTIQVFNDGEGHSGLRSIPDPAVTVGLVVPGLAPVAIGPVKLSALGAALAPINALAGPLALLGITLGLTVAGPPAFVASPFPAGSSAVVYNLLDLKVALGAPLPTLGIADLKVGHFEAGVTLPNGPISCTIPVAKTANPMSVTAGQTFTQNIIIPSSIAALNDSACDLTNIHVTDKIGVKSGSPTFTVSSISNGGTYNPATQTITFANIGNYHPGDTPIVLTINFSIPASSGAGVLQDLATVTSGLGNCTGGATGQASLIGNVGAVVVNGQFLLIGPSVGAGGTPLPRTGGPGPMIAWVGAALLAAAEATRRLVHRSRQSELS